MMIKKKIVLIWGVCIPFALASDMINSLLERGFSSQAHLFIQGQLWEQENDQTSLHEAFLRHDYDRFRSDVLRQYPTIADAPFKTRYDFARACYQQQDIPALSDALLTVSANVLSAAERDSVAIMKARVLYEAGTLKPLEDYFFSQNSNGQLGQASLKDIELLRDALFVKLMKPAVFADRHPYITYRVAFAQIEKGQFAEAIQSLLKSGFPEEHPVVLYTKGLLSLQTSRFQEANDYFETALGGDSDLDMEIRYRQIEASIGLAHYDESLTMIRDFREKYSENIAYIKWISFQECLANIHLGQMGRVAGMLENLAGAFPVLYYYLGQEALIEGRDEKAVQYFQKAALAFGHDMGTQTNILYALAWAEFRAGQFVSAKEHFAQLLKRTELDDTKRIVALMKLGDASYNLHNYKEAAKEYTVVITRLEPQKLSYPELYSRALINQSRIMGKLRQTDAAVGLLDEYIQRSTVSSDLIEAIKMKANLYALDNNLDKSNQALIQLVDLYGFIDEDVVMALADNRFNLNQFEGALQTYQRYLETFPSGDRRMDARYGEVQSMIRLKRYKEAQIQAGFTDAEFGTQLYLEVEKTIELIKQQEPSK